MAKDSQIDPKQVRAAKAKGGATSAMSGPDGESRNAKKQSVKPQGSHNHEPHQRSQQESHHQGGRPR